MSFKKDLLDKPKEFPYIPEFDVYSDLDMMEQCMLSYLIDNDDKTKKNGDWMEITPTYIKLKRPGWKESSIRTALKKLVEKELIIKKPGLGRGNFYKLNLQKLYFFIDQKGQPACSKGQADCKNLQADCKNLQADCKNL